MEIKKKNIIILAIFACFMWSTAFAGIKVTYNFINAPFTLGGIRFFLAGLVLLPFYIKSFDINEIRDNLKLIVEVTLLQTFIGYAFYYQGLTLVGGAIASIVAGSGPVVVAFLTHFMTRDDKFSLPKVFSLLLGFLGIVTIILGTKPLTAVGAKESLGIVFILINVIMGGLAAIKISKSKNRLNPVMLSSVQMIIGGFLLFLMGFFVEGKQNFNVPMTFYVAMIWLVLVSSVATALWFILLQQKGVKVSELNMWKFIMPFFGALLSYILLDEKITLNTIIGMIFVTSSLLIYYLKQKKSS